MLVDAVDLYLRSPGHDRAEIRAFAALVDGLLDGAAAPARRRVSIALAKRTDTPPEIARRLANDSIDVAEAMIVDSPVLTSSDLVEIMRRGPEHVRCVTRRLDLAPDIAAVLVDATAPGTARVPIAPATRRRGDAGDVDAESRRPDARPTTPAPSDPPKPEGDFLAPDLPAPMFAVPVRPTPTKARATETSDPAVERPARREAAAAARSGFAFIGLDSAGRWRALQSASLETATRTAPSRGGAPVPGSMGDRLLKAVLAEDRSGFARELSEALGLEPTLIDAILAEASGEVLAIVLIACGIGEIRATSILLHHLGPTASLGMLQDLVALVERTPRRVAEHLVTSWREEPSTRRTTALRQSDPSERREAVGAPREAESGEVRTTGDGTVTRRA